METAESNEVMLLSECDVNQCKPFCSWSCLISAWFNYPILESAINTNIFSPYWSFHSVKDEVSSGSDTRLRFQVKYKVYRWTEAQSFTMLLSLYSQSKPIHAHHDSQTVDSSHTHWQSASVSHTEGDVRIFQIKAESEAEIQLFCFYLSDTELSFSRE